MSVKYLSLEDVLSESGSLGRLASVDENLLSALMGLASAASDKGYAAGESERDALRKEVERLKKELEKAKYHRCTCSRCTGIPDAYSYYEEE